MNQHDLTLDARCLALSPTHSQLGHAYRYNLHDKYQVPWSGSKRFDSTSVSVIFLSNTTKYLSGIFEVLAINLSPFTTSVDKSMSTGYVNINNWIAKQWIAKSQDWKKSQASPSRCNDRQDVHKLPQQHDYLHQHCAIFWILGVPNFMNNLDYAFTFSLSVENSPLHTW